MPPPILGVTHQKVYTNGISECLWVRTSGGGPICCSPHSRLAEPMNGGKQGDQNIDPLWVGQPMLGLILMPRSYCPTHKGSNIFVNYCFPPVVRASPSDTGGYDKSDLCRGPFPMDALINATQTLPMRNPCHQSLPMRILYESCGQVARRETGAISEQKLSCN